jgi:import inner membrane translocase subunit TIM50
VVENTYNRYQDVYYPSSDKLLPDFPSPFYGNVPPGAIAPPVLVLDLERTLIGSIYDAQYGWRHVKRPGVDRLIDQLKDYYEIVIFSENDKGMTYDIMEAIDRENRCHKFGVSEAEVDKDGSVLKRLDFMNRDLSRIILIDDNEDSARLFPRNTLQIKPFTNIYDKNDRALLELIPLLQALIHEGIRLPLIMHPAIYILILTPDGLMPPSPTVSVSMSVYVSYDCSHVVATLSVHMCRYRGLQRCVRRPRYP